MSKYIIKRILIAIPVLLGITIIDYAIMCLAGSPLEILQGPRISEAAVEAKRIALGLDKPIYVQYFVWLGELLRGNMGYSLKTFQSVSSMIGTHLGPTLLLMGVSLVVSLIMAVPAGIYSAIHQYSKGDYTVVTLSFLGSSVPGFFLSLLLIFLFTVKLGWLPSSGMTTLGGLFPEKRFVAGTPITVKTVNLATGQTEQTMIGVAYVAAETSDITELWQAFISIFFFTAVVVLCVAFITSSITSLRLTNPLKEIAETARKFGHGEYEVRVQGYEKRKDEVGELAEAFNAMADSIAKSEARRSEFVANVSHELRTPLTNIRSYAETLSDSAGDIPPAMEKKFLGVILGESDRMTRIVQDLLTLSRFDSGRDDLKLVRFSFEAAVQDLYNTVYMEAQRHSHTLELELEHGLPEVTADRERIVQVMMNIVSNSIKYTPDGGKIVISAGRTKDRVWLQVDDNGIGIPPEDRPRFFERFYRVDKSHSKEIGGTGLGLSIVKHGAAYLGAQVELESCVGEGSLFRLVWGKEC